MKIPEVEKLTLTERENLFRLGSQAKLKRQMVITPVGRSRPLPLSFAQQRLWFLVQLEGASPAYNMSLGVRLSGSLNRNALTLALDRIVARHEALRTTFIQVRREPCQVVADPEIGFFLREHDLAADPVAEQSLQQITANEATNSFDLKVGPPIRGRLIQIQSQEHVLLITMHHIVSDGWSLGIFLEELSTLYEAYRLGLNDPLPRPAVQYPDFAVWQRCWLTGEVLQKQEQYWRTALHNAPALSQLPTDRARPDRQDYAGSFATIEFNQQLTSELVALSRRHNTTLFMTLLAAWAVVLFRLSGQEDFVIGAPVANRTRTEVESIIGFFVNMLALRLDLSGDSSFCELLQHVKTRVLEAQQYQDLPFERVVQILRPTRSLAHSPLFQVCFAWQNYRLATLKLPCLTLIPMITPRVTAKFDLTLFLWEEDQRIVGGIEYATALFERSTIDEHIASLSRVMVALVADEQRHIGDLNITRTDHEKSLATK